MFPACLIVSGGSRAPEAAAPGSQNSRAAGAVGAWTRGEVGGVCREESVLRGC